MKSDRVLTINDYYDGPRIGVAELNGIPHIYEAEFDHSSDEYGDTYFLAPIGRELLGWVLEDWNIWLRWHDAHRQGKATLDTHPALPEDRERHLELKTLIGDRLRVEVHEQRYRGTFTTASEARGTWQGTLVKWEAV